MLPHAANEDERRRGWRKLAAGVAVLAIVVGCAATGVLHLDVLVLANATGALMVALAVAFFGWVLLFGGLQPAQKKRVLVIASFFICSSLFWAGYEQAGSTFNLFARDHTDRTLFGSWFSSGQHPVSWYQSFPAVFVLLLAPIFAWLWVALGKRNLDPPAPAKFGLGLLLLGLGFALMMLAASRVLMTGHPAAPAWLVLTFMAHVAGELCLSPIGLSNVTKLAPSRFVSQMMGTWFLGMAIGNLSAGLIGGEVGGGSIADMPSRFMQMAVVGIGGGILMLACSGVIKRLMGGVR